MGFTKHTAATTTTTTTTVAGGRHTQACTHVFLKVYGFLRFGVKVS